MRASNPSTPTDGPPTANSFKNLSRYSNMPSSSIHVIVIRLSWRWGFDNYSDLIMSPILLYQPPSPLYCQIKKKERKEKERERNSKLMPISHDFEFPSRLFLILLIWSARKALSSVTIIRYPSTLPRHKRERPATTKSTRIQTPTKLRNTENRACDHTTHSASIPPNA